MFPGFEISPECAPPNSLDGLEGGEGKGEKWRERKGRTGN